MNLWTKEEIYKILMQLDRMKLPFKNYSFVQENGKLKLLGSGGSADVYEAKSRISDKKNYAIKVIGFRNQNMDSTEFDDSVWAQREICTFPGYVVKIYAHKELWITFDENDHIVSAEKKKPVELLRTSLKLQFIVMEKMTPVIKKNRDGSRNLIPGALEKGEEKEILKLAYDIGTALKEAGARRVLPLKVSGPFHSPMMRPAGEELAKVFAGVSMNPLKIPYVANINAEVITDCGRIEGLLVEQVSGSVRWQQSVETMIREGVDTFVEIGPGKTLTGFLRKIDKNVKAYHIGSWEEAVQVCEELK